MDQGNLLSPPVDKHSTVSMMAVLFAVVLGFIILNVATASRSPRVWMDEVMFADPAINLASGEGFVSGAWTIQSRTEFFAGNSPLYPLALSAWGSVFGVGLTPLRSFNIVMTGASIGVIVCALIRLGWIYRRSHVVLLATLIYCGYGVAFSYRSCRYDILGMFLCSLLFLIVTIPNAVSRRSMLLLVAILLPWTGLQLAPYAAVIGAILLVSCSDRRKILLDFAIIGGGCVIGGLTMYLYWKHYGVFDAFVQSASHLARKGTPMAERIKLTITGLVADLSTLAMLIGVLVAGGIAVRKSGGSRADAIKRLLLASLLFAIVVPVFLGMTGKFPVYYSWMKYVPLVVCAIGLWSLLSNGMIDSKTARLCRAILLVGVVGACYGLPGRMAKIAKEWPVSDYRNVMQFVSGIARPDDLIYCDFPPYFGARAVTKDVMTPMYLPHMSDGEKQSTSLIIIQPSNATEVLSTIGGRWVKIAELDPAKAKNPNAQSPESEAYYLSAYRRSN